ncbi:hypothetical protein [Roseomonas mucosa]|uniref:hypothetical protein n=1 Tax=Roseomonas mucosa TaxID=207340 RepID=UPI0028D37122|nr:hypothetical protein [Roseomonas mucosa]
MLNAIKVFFSEMHVPAAAYSLRSSIRSLVASLVDRFNCCLRMFLRSDDGDFGAKCLLRSIEDRLGYSLK